MPEEQLEEEEGWGLGHRGVWALEERGRWWSLFSCFPSDSEARSSMAWVNMGRRDWRLGSRGEGMCLPPGAVFLV